MRSDTNPIGGFHGLGHVAPMNPQGPRRRKPTSHAAPYVEEAEHTDLRIYRARHAEGWPIVYTRLPFPKLAVSA